MVDGRVMRGDKTRAAVLTAAVELASTTGLDALSLGQLADTLAVSKSGLFAHWRNKEELQLATVAQAISLWTDRIVAPALRKPRGIRRLWAVHENRLAFYRECVLPGGCFFATTQMEFDDRTGPVRAALVVAKTDWLALLRQLAVQAMAAGELEPDTDPDQLAFEIDAAGLAAVHHARLLPDDAVYVHGRRAVLRRLRELSPTPSLLPLR